MRFVTCEAVALGLGGYLILNSEVEHLSRHSSKTGSDIFTLCCSESLVAYSLSPFLSSLLRLQASTLSVIQSGRFHISFGKPVMTKSEAGNDI